MHFKQLINPHRTLINVSHPTAALHSQKPQHTETKQGNLPTNLLQFTAPVNRARAQNSNRFINLESIYTFPNK